MSMPSRMPRFTYAHSSVYGWCVYDREYMNNPAYEACASTLPHQIMSDGTEVSVSPVLLPSEYRAMSLCAQLNRALKKCVSV